MNETATAHKNLLGMALCLLLVFCALFPQAARAQQVVAGTGMSLSASGPITTGTLPPTAGYALWASAGGTITGTPPLAITTGGVGSFAAYAQTGGQIILNGGSIDTTGQRGHILYADGLGSSITATGMGMTATGPDTVGAVAANGATLTLHGGTLTINSVTTTVPSVVGPGFPSIPSGTGLLAFLGSSNIFANDLSIQMTSTGALASGPSTVTLENVDIAQIPVTGTTYNPGDGIYAGGTGALIKANNTRVSMSNGNAVTANQGSVVTISNATLNTSGAVGRGLAAFSDDPAAPATINAADVVITTTGAGEDAIGVTSVRSSIVNLKNVEINTHGDDAWGIDVQGALSFGPTPAVVRVVGTNVTVNTYGDTGWGLVDYGTGTLDLTNSHITAYGTSSPGFYVADPGSIITLRNSVVTSRQLYGGRVETGGTLNAIGSTITGATDAIQTRGADGSMPNNTINIVGGSLIAQGGDVIHAINTFSDITLTGPLSISTSSGNLLNVESNGWRPPPDYSDPAASSVTFTASNVAATGNIISDAASTANVMLSNGAVITGIQQNTFTTVDGTSTWIMNGNSDIHSLALAGTARFTPPAAGSDPTNIANYKTLTTQNYAGKGGTMVFNTYLAGDGAASDRLIIDGGQAEGLTYVQVANTGGLGALTIGNGIPLVQAIHGGTTALGAFTLAGRVSAGAYDYLLYRGGAGTPDDWYLRSTLTPEPPIPPTPGPEPTPPALPAPSLPNYRMEVPVYMAAQAMVERMGREMLRTYHDRVGEDHPGDPHGKTDDGNTVTPDVASPDMMGWVRVFGHLGHMGFGKGAANFASQGPKYDYGIDGVQLGFEPLRHTRDSGTRDIFGLYGGYMHGHADVNQVYSGSRAGSVDMDAYSLGGTYTIKGVPGWYLDAVLQGMWYVNGEARSQMGQKIHPNGFGLTASLEGGYPVALGKGWAVEPQAQIIYQWDQLGNDSDQYGQVKYQDITAWTGRIGARLTKDWKTESGKKGTVWARANIWHQFGSDAKTTFTNVNGAYPVGLRTSLGDTWGQVGLGVSGQLTQRISAFASADFSQSLGNNNGHSLSGRVELRYEF